MILLTNHESRVFAEFAHDNLVFYSSESINPMILKFIIHIDFMVESNIPPVGSKFGDSEIRLTKIE